MTDRELFTMVLESLESLNRTGDTQVFDMCDAPVLIPALCARLSTCDRCGKVNPAELHTCTPPQPEQEQMPTKIMGPNLEEVLNAAGFYKQREWVGLTDEELHALHFELKVQTMGGINTLGMYRILEKALREKNT